MSNKCNYMFLHYTLEWKKDWTFMELQLLYLYSTNSLFCKNQMFTRIKCFCNEFSVVWCLQLVDFWPLLKKKSLIIEWANEWSKVRNVHTDVLKRNNNCKDQIIHSTGLPSPLENSHWPLQVCQKNTSLLKYICQGLMSEQLCNCHRCKQGPISLVRNSDKN